MEIRDPIHGFIQYNELEEKIINTWVLQRLRGIKQLALANYVYPGSLHTRFDHSLGVMHLAEKIAKRLGFDDEKKRIVKLAGLLHDIGHGPFSHVSEQILEMFTPDLKNLLSKWKADHAHELLSILLIEFDKDLNKIIGETEKEGIKRILQSCEDRFLEKDVISGPIDADKLDYLLRDSYFTGVKYGIFDIDKIIESMVEIRISKESSQVGIKDEGIFALEQFLLANYHMKMQVYYHRIRRILDAMLVRGIEFAVKNSWKVGESLFTIKDTEEYIQNYLRFDDYILFDIILKEGDKISKEYFERIKRRCLFKEICKLELKKEVLEVDVVVYDQIMRMKKKDFGEMARATSEFLKGKYKLKIRPEFIIVDRQTITNPTFKSPGITIDSKTILVLRNQKRESFDEVSDVFKNPSVEPERNFLYIYAPIDDLDKEKREKIKSEVTQFIKDYLKNKKEV